MSRQLDPENLTEDDVEYVRVRPLLRQDFIRQGYGDPLDPEYPGLVSSDSEDDEDEETSNYSSMDKAELEAEVESRNEDRLDEDKIVVEGTGSGGKVTKKDLLAALEADDADDDDDE